MSTKAIRKTLMMMKMDPMSQDFDDRPAYTAALSEVEAIERAAKVIDDNLCAQVYASNAEKVEAALKVVASVAENAP